ncbi:hypothetical protein [Streptomyces sp. NPDC001530]|uniref:hypothetical protein n=1 Tax=Streptomyces sp. NPDC001530 TaxID=3364582 RepID=UPI00369DE3AD
MEHVIGRMKNYKILRDCRRSPPPMSTSVIGATPVSRTVRRRLVRRRAYDEAQQPAPTR